VFCQLETLRHAVQPNVRRILEKLPKTLDETYELVLKNINENNQEHARRLLHCLAVSVRPLRVEELAEILTFDFDEADGSIPKFHPDRRPINPEQAILSICSSFIAIVDHGGCRVVQFSHLSVKEFLTSTHLASSSRRLSSYYIIPGPAHTTLAQVCLGLLQSNNRSHNESLTASPLSNYAARYWVSHAQFGDLASQVDGMGFLFDPDMPHFSAGIDPYDIDSESGGTLPPESPSPLYYSALYGFYDRVQHIAVMYPRLINAFGGSYGFPIVAALCRNDFPAVELLLELGGRVDVRDTRKQTVLHITLDRHDKVAIGAVRFLLKHGADVNAKRDDLCTPLHLAFHAGKLKAARILLEHDADVNARNDDGQTPLHLLSRWEAPKHEGDGSNVAKLLLERGAHVNEKDKDNATPLHLASYYRRLEIVQVLLDHGANMDIMNGQGKTPLQLAIIGKRHAQDKSVGVARLLLLHGAESYARAKYPIRTSDLSRCFRKEKIGEVLLGDGDLSKPVSSWDESFQLWMEGKSPKDVFCRYLITFLEYGVDRNIHNMYETILLHLASYRGTPEMVGTLLNYCIKVNAKNYWGETALHVVSRGRQDPQGGARIAQLLLDRGADVNTRRNDHQTPLLVASCFGNFEIIRLLLDHGADVEAATGNMGEKPLHKVSYGKYRSQGDGVRVAQLLLDHGADVSTRRKDHWTPLHVASYLGNIEIVRLLLDHGADPEAIAEGDMGQKPLHLVSYGKCGSQEDVVRVAQLLLDRGADVNTRRNDDQTPLHRASYLGNIEIVRLLLDHGADLEAATDNMGEKPLHKVSYGKYRSQEDGVRVAQLLLDRGADVNTRHNDHQTPLHFASYLGNIEIVRLLLDHGADLEAATDNMGEKPLHQVSYGEYRSQEDGVRVAQLLLGRGADVNTRRKDDQTPLHRASYFGNVEIVHLLLDHGADLEAATGNMGEKPLHKVSYGKYRSQGDGVRVAQLLLDHGADVSTRRKDDRTPLHTASYYGNVEILHLLLDHGADPEAATDNMGEKPLHQVSYGEYRSQEDGVRVAQLLLDSGADVNTRRNDHQTPLHRASYFGNVEIVRLLLDHGADPEAIAEGDMGQKPLHLVSYGRCGSQEDVVRVAQLLLGRGANVNTRRKDDQTPLHRASYLGNVEIVRLLLDHGADLEAATDNMGEKPLHKVSYGKYRSPEDGVRVAQLLLDHGADVSTRRKDHWTPLHTASYYGNIEILHLLLDHGADPEAIAEGDMGEKPLHKVSYSKYRSQEDGVRVAQLLLDSGADVNTRRKDDQTPLHRASYFGNVEIVRLLLDHGADPEANAEGNKGLKPLHLVSYGKYRSQADGVRVAQLLLDRGAKVNARRNDRRTPLNLASYFGNVEIVQLLIDHGAEVNAVDDFGKSPLHEVSEGEYEAQEDGVRIARLFLGHGADVNAKDRSGYTPLNLASHYERPKLAELFLKHIANVNAS
jgi:ankyrin repeat protein